jgi:tetratricopeptide (TPR) repeat protein
MLKDRYGNGVSTRSRAALDKFDEACVLMRLYRGDPIAALDAALEEDPDFAMAWAARAGVLVQQTDKAYVEEAERSIRAGLAAGGNERERAHLSAAAAWAEGRYDDAHAGFTRIAHAHPRDLPAVQAAHIGSFFLGRASELRDGPLQALRAHREGDDAYHALLGMAAFGHEECGAYDQAQALGERAAAIEPRDAWAVHAVAHVHEMRGDLEAGTAWLLSGADQWAPENGFSYHNWWHLALLALDRGDTREALRLYDEKIRPTPDAQVVLEWIDASALLWRLYLEGVDVGDRWTPLAECWSRAGEDAFYAFNDLHAIMAFIGAGRSADIARTLAAMRRAAKGSDDNAYMTRAVGLPLAEAFAAFEAGRYQDAANAILAVRGVAQRFGGSHAQRDILTLTALHAALRGDMAETARALSAERVAHKPHSPWALRLSRRAGQTGDALAA